MMVNRPCRVPALALDFAVAWLLSQEPPEARQAGQANPAGAAHKDVRRFRSSRKLLPEIPDPLANPAALSPGAA